MDRDGGDCGKVRTMQHERNRSMKPGDKVRVEGDKRGDYWLVDNFWSLDEQGDYVTVENEEGWKWTMNRENVKPV